MRPRLVLSALAGAVLASCLASPSVARAEPPAPAAAQETADELFRHAGQAYDAGDLSLAHSLYTRAFEKKKTHDIAAMLAQTELKLGRPCEAVEHLTLAIAAFPPSLADDRRERLQRALAAARKQIGSLRVDTSPAGAAVQVDFRRVSDAALPGPFCVPAGDRIVFVTRPGYAVERRNITVEPGQLLTLRAELRPVGAPAPGDLSTAPLDPPAPSSEPPAPSSAPPAPSSDPRAAASSPPAAPPGLALSSTPDPASSIALSGLFVGAGALLTGAVLLPLGLEELGRADALYRDITSRAGTTAPCAPLSDYREACAEHRALSTDGAALANAGLTSLLAGAGLAAAAGGFLLLRSPVAGAGPGGPRVTVGGGPDGAFVALKGVF
ncbi:MAG: PEGA domain-containing protein [Polyangiaceae bacterium]